jgi:hypothetical protein
MDARAEVALAIDRWNNEGGFVDRKPASAAGRPAMLRLGLLTWPFWSG